MKFKTGDKVKYVKWFHDRIRQNPSIYKGINLGDILTIKVCHNLGYYSFEEINGEHHSIEINFKPIDSFEKNKLRERMINGVE